MYGTTIEIVLLVVVNQSAQDLGLIFWPILMSLFIPDVCHWFWWIQMWPQAGDSAACTILLLSRSLHCPAIEQVTALSFYWAGHCPVLLSRPLPCPAIEQVTALSCYWAGHSQHSQALSFIKWGWCFFILWSETLLQLCNVFYDAKNVCIS
jgi:hypothetical protein